LRTNDGFLQIRNNKNILNLMNNTTVNPDHLNTSNNYSQHKKFDIASMVFNFKSTKYIYTCDNGKCTEHKLKDAKTYNHTATVNGNVAYTRSDCFGSCKWESDINDTMDIGKDSDIGKGGQNNVNNCNNNWCSILTIVLIVLIVLSILMLR